ncbi:hypothetical protein MYXO_02295 [Myxococcaceae bacterium]|nr:hypothetical protein MYXO_02295 [Myxococcaceae bacterium]
MWGVAGANHIRDVNVPPRSIRTALLFSGFLGSAAAASALLAGDLDGDGSVGANDEALLASFYGSAESDPGYAAAGDLDGDGVIGVRDLARLGAAWGTSGGPVDTTPPSLRVTLNDIPDDMDDLLVAPPGGFDITIEFDAGDGSVIDPASLVVLPSLPIAGDPAFGDLAAHFEVGQRRAVWRVPADPTLGRTTHALLAQVRDAAGNPAVSLYQYAVRDFPYQRPPLGNPQRIFLDFDRNRSLGPDVDFLEDLRRYGLSTTSAPSLESEMRARLVAEIVKRTQAFYGWNADGTPGEDPVGISFSATPPAPPYSRLCVGGESSLGSIFLGAALLDVGNSNEASDECASGGQYGVFPQAIAALWPNSASYQAAFHPLDPSVGGIPVGSHPLDASVTSPSFDPATASAEEIARHSQIENAVDAFAQGVASAVAHETGHMLGLVAHGAAPGGLFGGTSGSATDHNLAAGGSVPVENYLMNAGGSFTFSELTGRDGKALPIFRPLNWAYLHDRVVLDSRVTGLFPPPTLSSISPNPIVVAPGGSATVTFHGSGFLETPSIQLRIEGDPTPNALLSETLLDGGTVGGVIHSVLVPPGLYDVEITNGDGQVLLAPDALEVQ